MSSSQFSRSKSLFSSSISSKSDLFSSIESLNPFSGSSKSESQNIDLNLNHNFISLSDKPEEISRESFDPLSTNSNSTSSKSLDRENLEKILQENLSPSKSLKKYQEKMKKKETKKREKLLDKEKKKKSKSKEKISIGQPTNLRKISVNSLFSPVRTHNDSSPSKLSQPDSKPIPHSSPNPLKSDPGKRSQFFLDLLKNPIVLEIKNQPLDVLKLLVEKKTEENSILITLNRELHKRLIAERETKLRLWKILENYQNY
eukprot:Sdes_comp22479_c0_seq1m20927